MRHGEKQRARSEKYDAAHQKLLLLVDNKPRGKGREGGRKPVEQPCNRELLIGKAVGGKGSQACQFCK